MPAPRSSRAAPRITQTSTPTLLNEAYTRLRACANALEHACGKAGVSGLHVWMNSYGARLNSMADVLQDEGARQRSSFAKSAETLYLEDTCSAPKNLLGAVELIQERMLQTYEQLSMRLDMDEELYDILLEQERELCEVMADVTELRMEYEAYGNVNA